MRIRLILGAVLFALPSTLLSQPGGSGDKALAPVAKPGAATAQPTVFRQTVRRVLVDVVVTDKQGNAVRGLSRSDFAVREDGKPQQILSFDVEDGSNPGFVAPELPPLPANTFVNLPAEPEKGPLYIMLYDMVNTETVDQMTVHKQIEAFIDNKPPGTQFAIFVNAAGLHMVQGFTSDRKLLHSAIVSEGPGPHLPNVFLLGRNYGAGSTSATVSVFQFLAEYLEGIPGRKNLIWLAGAFPMQLNADPTHERDKSYDDVKRTFAAMARSQIAVYPIDASGVRSMDRFEGMAQSAPSGARSNESITKGGVVAQQGTSGAFLQGTEIGNVTGGHFFTGDNDVREELQQAVAHGSNYYTVSYRPSNEKYDGTERHIEVKLARKGYELTYRQLYFAVAPQAEAAVPHRDKQRTMDAQFVAVKADSPLLAEIEHGVPMRHDLVFYAGLKTTGEPAPATMEQMLQLRDEPAFFQAKRGSQVPKVLQQIRLQKYLIDYRVLDPQLPSMAARAGQEETLEFAAVAYDADGTLLNGILNDGLAAGRKRPDGRDQYLFQLEQELSVPLDAAWIKVAVHDKLTNRTGTLEVQLPLNAAGAKTVD